MTEQHTAVREVGRDRPTASPLLLGCVVAAGGLGTSSIAPALPTIAADLALDLTATAAVMSAYTVPFAAMTIVGGQLVDALGPRRVLRPAVTTALVGVLLMLFATGAPMLLMGRALQGMGAAAGAVTGYVVARQRPNGLATAAAALTVGSASGPLLGGLASQLISWRVAVALPLPLLLVGLTLVVPGREQAADSTDVRGTTAVAVGASAVAAALQFAGVLGALTPVVLAVAVAVLVLAGRRTLAGRGHVPSRHLLRHPTLRTMGLLGMTTAATYFATLVIVPVGLGAQGWGPIAIGLALLPPAFSGGISSRMSHQIAARLGRWTEPIAAGLILVSVALVVTFPPLVGALSIITLAAAFGMIQPRFLNGMADVVTAGPATAIGTGNLVFLLGGGIGAATVGGLGATGGGVALLAAASVVAVLVGRQAWRDRG